MKAVGIEKERYIQLTFVWVNGLDLEFNWIR